MMATKNIKLYFFLLLIGVVTSCTNNSIKTKYTFSLDSLKRENLSLKEELTQARTQIDELKNTPELRLNNTKNLIASNNSYSAENELHLLISKYPISKEAKEAELIIRKLEEERSKKKADEERIKALGFKIFKDNSNGSINEIRYAISNLSYNRKFTFEDCDEVNEYSYETADRDQTYLLGSMSVTAKSKNASAPDLALYRIENGSLKFISTFDNKYASWSSYGAKVGNYSDDSHDFAKVSTIRYSIAALMNEEYMRLPLFVLIKKDDSKSYYSDYDTLTLQQVSENFVVIRIINREKI